MKDEAFSARRFSQVCEVYQVLAVAAFLRNQCTIDNLYLIQHNQNGWNTDASERSQQKDHLIYETMAAYLKLGNFSFLKQTLRFLDPLDPCLCLVGPPSIDLIEHSMLRITC